MKLSSIVLLLISITTLNSCMKESISTSSEETIVRTSSEEIIISNAPEAVLATDWVRYDETFCSNPWGGSYYDSDIEKDSSIENYFINLEVEIFEINKSEVASPETFFLCVAKTGYVIKCKISEEDVSILIDEGFYQ